MEVQASSELHAARLSPGHTLPASPHPSTGSGRPHLPRVNPGTEPAAGGQGEERHRRPGSSTGIRSKGSKPA
ncbi:unnamed protein product [Boreogadus saida]